MIFVDHLLLLLLLPTIILVCCAVASVDSLRILLLPLPVQSHMACMTSVGLGLTARNHEVYTIYPEGIPLPPDLRNPSDIRVELYKRPSLDASPVWNFNEAYDNLTRMILEDKATDRMVFDYIGSMSGLECRMILLHNEVLMDRLNDLSFDVAVLDGVFFGKCLNLIPHRLRVPYVTLTDTLEPSLVRVPWLPSFVSTILTPYTDEMNFFERLRNTVTSTVLAAAPLVQDPDDEVLAKYRTYGPFESISELAARTLLWITTSDHILDYARPTMPNLIQAPGLTTKPSVHDLPENIKVFIDSSRLGVILVSFGSMSSQFPPFMTEKFLSAFARLKEYRVIWRFENKHQMKLPEDILALSWIPQNDILANPKTKLFITHCGNNGQHESLYHAIPMIGFPLHGDQPYNAKRMVHKGFGLAMDIHDFTADELFLNIEKILSDNSFKEKISKASEILRSAPQTPREKAAWWVEHVAKFGGSHLHSAGNDLSLYQYLMIDVLAFVLVVFIFIVFCFWKTMRLICRKLFKRTKRLDKAKRQ